MERPQIEAVFKRNDRAAAIVTGPFDAIEETQRTPNEFRLIGINNREDSRTPIASRLCGSWTILVDPDPGYPGEWALAIRPAS